MQAALHGQSQVNMQSARDHVCLSQLGWCIELHGKDNSLTLSILVGNTVATLYYMHIIFLQEEPAGKVCDNYATSSGHV